MANMPTDNPERLSKADSQEIARRRSGRSWAIFLALLGLCALFYAIAIIKMASH